MRYWLDVSRRLVRQPVAVAGMAGFAAVVAACIVFPEVSPYDPYAVDFDQGDEGPSLAHPFGTDLFGRDLLTRMALGGRASLLVAGGALAVILVVGFLYGSVAALAGGKVDEAMMRLLDGLLALPRLPIMLVILAIVRLNASLWTLILALSIANWMLTARLVRTQVIGIRTTEYVRAAHALGARGPHLLVRHILPNTLAVLVVVVFLELPTVILGEAFVSVLGLGLNPPEASWGTIAQDGVESGRLWLVVLPSAAIAALAVSANVVADRLGDALDPRRS